MVADQLEDELRALGRDLAVAEVDLAPAVLARLVGEPAPAAPAPWRAIAGLGRWVRARWRGLLAVLLGSVVVVAVATPVGAAVVNWLRLGGVVVREEPAPPITSTAPITPATPTTPVSSSGTTDPPGPWRQISKAEAARLLGTEPLVPELLGAPASILVSADQRVVSLRWNDGVVLDQFTGEPDWLYVKTVSPAIEFTDVGSAQGLWFPQPHALVYRDTNGVEHTEAARLAGPTLVWTVGTLTLRLEGIPDKAQALSIGISAR